MKNIFALILTGVLLIAFPTIASEQPYTSDETELGIILDDPKAAAILDKFIPGFTTNEQVDLARAMTLRDIQMYSPDEITDELLAKIDNEFKKVKN